MIAAFFAACLVLLIVVALLARRKSSAVAPRPQIPKVWPLLARPLVNSKERRIWVWLSQVMHDQHVMIKLPVTRFTIPAKQEGAEHWYNMLNRVYCTFTICGHDGRVIGCVDVPGNAGLSMSNQTLKYGLLTQCGIPYWVIEPDNLPHKSQIRAAFLGESAVVALEPETAPRPMKAVEDLLQAAVSRQRNPAVAQPPSYGFEPSITKDDGPVSEGWEQNSFMVPLDSRAGALREE